MRKRGVGVVGGGVVPASAAPSVSTSGRLPWQCGWIPGFMQLYPERCTYLPNPPIPAAPVIPAGALDPGQTPGGDYSVDQVVFDTAATQRAQTQNFFSDLSAQLGLVNSEPAGFPWHILAAVAVVGGGVFLLGRRSRG